MKETEAADPLQSGFALDVTGDGLVGLKHVDTGGFTAAAHRDHRAVAGQQEPCLPELEPPRHNQEVPVVPGQRVVERRSLGLEQFEGEGVDKAGLGRRDG